MASETTPTAYRFQRRHATKRALLLGLLVFSIIYYFLLPIGVIYAPELFVLKVFGPVKVGILFAWSPFIVAIATYYTVRA
ncbi:MAG TPA: DUF485 domain-containing protein [Rhodocyclaceae bacterium]|nr:DUF485 domain-containing protein [Rhodocyclaceae bacterium]